MKARTSRYVATFEVFPEVALQPMDRLELERVTAEVTESDIDAMIERLRKQQLKYSQVARAAASGDKVTIDFLGTIDGVEFAGGKGENIGDRARRGPDAAGARAGLIGAVAGEHRDISVNFPADYRATEFAGKTAIFSTEVKTVEEPALPEVDEEFCKAFGVTEGGVPKLREDVAANMRRELEQTLRTRNKAAVMEKLYQANPIEVPNALIEAQIRDMQIEAMRRAGTKDVSRRRRANRSSSPPGAASRSA